MNKSKYLATTSLGFGVLRAFALSTVITAGAVSVANASADDSSIFLGSISTAGGTSTPSLVVANPKPDLTPNDDQLTTTTTAQIGHDDIIDIGTNSIPTDVNGGADGGAISTSSSINTSSDITINPINEDDPVPTGYEPSNLLLAFKGETSGVEIKFLDSDGEVSLVNFGWSLAEIVDMLETQDDKININDFIQTLTNIGDKPNTGILIEGVSDENADVDFDNEGVEEEELGDFDEEEPENALLMELLGDKLAADGTISKADLLDRMSALYHVSYILRDASGELIGDDVEVESSKILSALPKAWTVEEVIEFRIKLDLVTDENGEVERQTAIDLLIAEVIKRPGDAAYLSLEKAKIVPNVYDRSVDVIGVKNVTLYNEVDIVSESNGITVVSADFEADEVRGDVLLENRGAIESRREVIVALGVNVDITNSGDLKSEGWNGIKVNAEGDATVDNTGAISAADTAIETRAYGQVTVKNAGDLTVSNSDDGMDDYHNYNQFGGISAIGLEGATVENHGNISDAIWAIEVAGSFATVTNTGDLSAAIGIDAVSIAGSFDFTDQGNDEDDDFIEKGTLTGGSTTVNNTGDISLNGDSYGDAYKYGEHRLYIGHIGIIGLAVNGLEIEYTDGYGGGTDVFTPLATLADTTQLNVTITNSGNIIAMPVAPSEGIHDVYSSSETSSIGIVAFAEVKISLTADAHDAYSSAEVSSVGAYDVTTSMADSTHDAYSSAEVSSIGIAALAEHTITITNSGEIDVNDAGIKAMGNGEISITNSGAINVSNSNGGTGGIAATSGHWISGELGEAVDITNTAKISVDGDHMRGIRAWSNGGDVSVTNEGEIVTKGYKGRAIQATSGNTGECTWEFNSETNSDECLTATPVVSGGKITVDNKGVISTDGEKARAILARSAGGEIKITNTGIINTTSKKSEGIYARSGNKDTRYMAQHIVGNAIEITNKAAITTLGEESEGIDAWSNGGAVTVTNDGDITTSGDYSRGIQAESGSKRSNEDYANQIGGTVDVTNNNAISTEGKDAASIKAWSNGGAVTVTNAGALSTTGENSRGISAGSGNSRTADSRVVQEGGNVTVINSGTIDTLLSDSIAIEAWSNGGDISVTNDAALTTKGKDSTGLRASSGNANTSDNREVYGGGDIIITNNAAISTLGEGALGYNSGGIAAWSNGGDVTVKNTATVETKGDNSDAIHANSGDKTTANIAELNEGAVIVDNDATLTTYATRSRGISASSNGGVVTVTNDGDITTKGAESRGINANSGSTFDGEGYTKQVGGIVDVTNNNAISTEGKDAASIKAWSNGGAVSVTNAGALSTTGEDSYGLSATSGNVSTNDGQAVQKGGAVTVTNNNTVKTTGQNSDSIKAWSNGGAVTVNNTGAVSTDGENSRGISAGSGNSQTDEGREVQEGGNVTVTNTGIIATLKNYASAISAWSNGGTIDVTTQGAISTKGDDSAGIQAFSGNSRTEDRVPQLGKNINVTNNSDISTTGSNSDGIIAWSNGGDVKVDNNAAIQTAGEESYAIGAFSGEAREGFAAHDGGAVTVNNFAALTTTGDKSTAIKVQSVGGLVTINNEGKIDTQAGIGILAASINGGDVNITNKAEISGKSLAIGIFAQDASQEESDEAGPPTFGAAKGTITNEGKIDISGEDSLGLVMMATDSATITNKADVTVVGQTAITALGVKSATVNNTGNVSLTRSWSESDTWNPAIGVLTMGLATLTNSGDVTTTGALMHGLYVGGVDTQFGGAGAAMLTNSGSIITNGAGSAGISARLFGAGDFTNTGSILTNSAANAVELEWKKSEGDVEYSDPETGETVDAPTTSIAYLSNEGTIEAKDGLAISSVGLIDRITNSGTIIGGASLGDQDDFFANGVDGILKGNFDLGAGEDALLVSNLGIEEATFDGGQGTDSVGFTDGGDIADSKFSNFEIANLLSGNFSGSGLNAFTKEVNVDGGYLLIGADETTQIVGDLNVNTGGIYLGATSADEYASINVGGSAIFASTSLLNVVVSDPNQLLGDDKLAMINATVIDFKDLDNETEEAFEIADDYTALNFSGIVSDNDAGGQSLIVSVIETLTALIETVNEKTAEKLEKVIEFVQADDETLNTEQKNIVDFVHKQLALSHDGNEERLEAFVEEITSNQSTQSNNAVQSSSTKTAMNISSGRVVVRTSGAGSAGSNDSSGPNANGYAPENKQHAAIRHINSMTDEGNEGSMTFSQTGQAWIQLFKGRISEKTSSSKLSGGNWGGAAGIDYMLDNNNVVGMAFVFSDSKATSRPNLEVSTTDTQTFGLTAYGGGVNDYGTGYSGSLGYFRSKHEGSRSSVSGNYKSEYDSNTFVVRGGVSQTFKADGVTFVPQASLTYTRSNIDAYAETGGGVPKTMDALTTQSLLGSFGASVSTVQFGDGVTFIPELHVNALYEFNDVLGSYTGSLAGINGSNFSADINATDRLKWNVGASVKIDHTQRFNSEVLVDSIFSDSGSEQIVKYKGSYKF